MKHNIGIFQLGAATLLLAAVSIVALAPLAAADQTVYTQQGNSCNQSNSGTVTVNVNVINNYNCSDADNNTVYACDNTAQQEAGAGAYGGGWYYNPSSGSASASATASQGCVQKS